jgi:hypothetical protein
VRWYLRYLDVIPDLEERFADSGIELPQTGIGGLADSYFTPEWLPSLSLCIWWPDPSTSPAAAGGSAPRGTMDDEVQASTQRVRDHLRRPLVGSRGL